MYESHFNLEGNPFRATADPELIYESAELVDALAHFRYALDSGESFVLLTGEVGCGKTTAVQAFLQKLDGEVAIAKVSHATLDPIELLHDIAERFGLSVDPQITKPRLIAQLEKLWQERKESGASSLLVLDEAHLLKDDVLEEVRLLSNLEHAGSRLLHVFLVGQHEIEDRLRKPQLRPLRQRISLRYNLKPLDFEETKRYLVHRLIAAGAQKPTQLFTPGAVEALRYLSHGLPREINVIAGQAMLTAFLEGATQVDTEHVRAAKSEFGFEGVAESSTRTQEPSPAAAEPLTPPVALKPAPDLQPQERSTRDGDVQPAAAFVPAQLPERVVDGSAAPERQVDPEPVLQVDPAAQLDPKPAMVAEAVVAEEDGQPTPAVVPVQSPESVAEGSAGPERAEEAAPAPDPKPATETVVESDSPKPDRSAVYIGAAVMGSFLIVIFLLSLRTSNQSSPPDVSPEPSTVVRQAPPATEASSVASSVEERPAPRAEDSVEERPEPSPPPSSSPPPAPTPAPPPPTDLPAVAADPGYLTVVVEPWARVTIDGNPAGETPLARIELPAGTHTIVLENDNVVGLIRDEIAIESGDNETRRYSFSDTGNLSLVATPWADVSVDGRSIGQTPLGRVAVPAGPHLIRFVHPELGETERDVVVVSGETTLVRVDLQ